MIVMYCFTKYLNLKWFLQQISLIFQLKKFSYNTKWNIIVLNCQTLIWLHEMFTLFNLLNCHCLEHCLVYLVKVIILCPIQKMTTVIKRFLSLFWIELIISSEPEFTKLTVTYINTENWIFFSKYTNY